MSHCFFWLLLFLMRSRQTFWIIHYSLVCNVGFLLLVWFGFASGCLQDFFSLILVFIILMMAVPRHIFLRAYLSWGLLRFMTLTILSQFGAILRFFRYFFFCIFSPARNQLLTCYIPHVAPKCLRLCSLFKIYFS